MVWIPVPSPNSLAVMYLGSRIKSEKGLLKGQSFTTLPPPLFLKRMLVTFFFLPEKEITKKYVSADWFYTQRSRF